MSMTEALAQLDKAMKPTPAGSITLDKEGLIKHIATEFTAANAETDPALRVARFEYIREVTNLAKNFEGAANTMTIPLFKDPGQKTPTEAAGNMNAGSGDSGANYGTEPAPAKRNVADNATAPSPAPPEAPASGAPFATPGGNFAKALDMVTAEIEKAKAAAAGGTPTPTPTPEPAAADSGVQKNDDAPEPAAETVEKNAPVQWADDMNQPDEFSGIDSKSHFGFDPGSAIAKRYAERVEKSEKSEK